MQKNMYFHRSFLYMQVCVGTERKRVLPGIGESGKWGDPQAGWWWVPWRIAKGTVLNAGRLCTKTPCHKREVRKGRVRFVDWKLNTTYRRKVDSSRIWGNFSVSAFLFIFVIFLQRLKRLGADINMVCPKNKISNHRVLGDYFWQKWIWKETLLKNLYFRCGLFHKLEVNTFECRCLCLCVYDFLKLLYHWYQLCSPVR